MTDLSGVWLGTYWQHQPVRFEMTLVQGGNALSGNILDDNYLGEAIVAGTITGRSISFIKRYLTGQCHAVSYSGTVSQNGNKIQGQWSISSLSGAWEAHRHDDTMMAELNKRLQKKIPALAETDK
ncbi:MAG: hypothetical protein AAF383_07590 [Cyanobacteria bacterium P01_A01_bin.83]